MKTAVDYVGLIGKYVSAERPPTETEKKYQDGSVGGAGIVVSVWDNADRVLVTFDDGTGFSIHPDDKWELCIGLAKLKIDSVWPTKDYDNMWSSR